ncbi:hypothetical protein [Paenibacillus agricola]|uniref:Uncharacterized protein n=1 Tax=Paenibacillus agricola TaxID=2716264 RepID=A0ABX0J267_9BACL|nr:hypothetical protein [Paenibacillus agricola]NHN29521.1 hypothetical protein [Paenibacillus agricola]
MSKGRVWNKGKHNGGKGGPLKGTINPREVTRSTNKQLPHQEEQSPTENVGEVVDSRVDRIGRMNRDNWVSRPVRVNNENARDESESDH